MLSFRVLAIATMMIVPSFALAEPGHHDGPCKSEVQQLCAGVQPGGGRIRECMKEHRAQLSVACKVAIADRMLEHAGQRRGDGQGPGQANQAMGQGSMNGAPRIVGGGGAAIKPVGN